MQAVFGGFRAFKSSLHPQSAVSGLGRHTDITAMVTAAHAATANVSPHSTNPSPMNSSPSTMENTASAAR